MKIIPRATTVKKEARRIKSEKIAWRLSRQCTVNPRVEYIHDEDAYIAHMDMILINGVGHYQYV